MIKNTHHFLAYFGISPFLILSLLLIFGNENTLSLFDLEFFFYSYSLAIICFICGSHWGMILQNTANSFDNILILSNVVTLTAWLAISFHDKSYTLLFNILCFIALLIVEIIFLKKKIIKPDYLKTRVIASSFVIFLTIMVLFSL